MFPPCSPPAPLLLSSSYPSRVRQVTAKASELRVDVCAGCGHFAGKLGNNKLLQCASCKSARFCDRRCQIAAWRTHHKQRCAGRDTGKELARQRMEAVVVAGNMYGTVSALCDVWCVSWFVSYSG